MKGHPLVAFLFWYEARMGHDSQGSVRYGILLKMTFAPTSELPHECD